MWLLLAAAASVAVVHADDFGFGVAPTSLRIGALEPEPAGPLKIHFDCYLNTGVSCQDLERSFFEADPFAERGAAAQADVSVEVRAWDAPPSEQQYEIRFKGSGDLPQFKLGGAPLALRATLSPQAKVIELTKHLIQGAAVFHKVAEYKTNPEGKLVVTYSPKGALPGGGKKDIPWYVSVGGGAHLGSNGATEISVFGGGKAGYSSPTWLFEVGAGAEYKYVSVETEQGDLTASNLRASGGVLAARSIAKHWSVMAAPIVRHDPGSNWDVRATQYTGIEYELIPFLESNDNAFTVSYVVGAGYENYVAPNVNDRMEEFIASHALSLYYVKHLDWVDLSAAAAVTSHIADPTKFAVGGRAGAKFYITRALTLDINGSVGYKQNIVNAPRDPDTSNPLLPVIGAGSGVAPLIYDLTLSVHYVWGNTMRRQKDMRWQFSAIDLPVNF